MNLWRLEQHHASVIGRALIPAGLFGGLRDHVDLGAALAAHVRTMPWWTAIIMRLALWIIWLAPPFLGLGLRSFGALAPDQRVHALETLLVSPVFEVRQLCDLLKLMYCMSYFGDEAMLRHLGAYRLAPTPTPQGGR